MRSSPTPSAQSEPNVTPFLDVLLVLLVSFMYPFLHPRKALDIQLPQPSSHAGDHAPAIVLEVKPNAVFFLDRSRFQRATCPESCATSISGDRRRRSSFAAIPP